MVTIPRKWATEAGLRQGQMVSIERPSRTSFLINLDSSLRLGKGKRTARVWLREHDSTESLLIKIASLYTLGYDVIDIRWKNGGFDYSHRKTINRFTRKYLAGAELVNDTEDKLILQVLFDYSEQTAEHFLKRMLSITSSMIKDSVLSFESMDKELAKHVVLKGDEVERLKLLAKRQLNTLGTHDMKAIELAQFIKIIEKIGDQACRIANETIVASQESFDQANTITIKKMGDFAQNLVDEVSLSLLKEDYKSAEESIRKTQEFLELEKELICSFKKDLAISSCEVSVVSVALLLHEIVCLAKDLAEIVLEFTVERWVSTQSINVLQQS
jgi:phosphate uptake regulator